MSRGCSTVFTLSLDTVHQTCPASFLFSAGSLLLHWRAAEILQGASLFWGKCSKKMTAFSAEIVSHLPLSGVHDTAWHPESMFAEKKKNQIYVTQLSPEPKGRFWRAGWTLCLSPSGFFVKALLVSLEAAQLVLLPAVPTPSSPGAF